MSLREVFATNLRAQRRRAGFSQEELAHRANLDRTYVSSLERASYSATIDVIERISIALSVDASTLLLGGDSQGRN